MTEDQIAKVAFIAVCLYTAYAFYKVVETMPGMSKSARNEGKKLSATALTNVGVGFVITGVVGPLLQPSSTTPSDGGSGIWGFMAIGALGLTLHLMARMILSKLED